MNVNWNAAAIVVNRQASILMKPHIDPVGVTGNSFVHRVVERFGKEMMQSLFIRPADIHAGAAAHRLQPFQHLNILGRIASVSFEARGAEADLTAGLATAEKRSSESADLLGRLAAIDTRSVKRGERIEPDCKSPLGGEQTGQTSTVWRQDSQRQ